MFQNILCPNTRAHRKTIFSHQVDEQDMTGMNHKEAIAFLRGTPNTVTLHFIRPSPQAAAVMSGKMVRIVGLLFDKENNLSERLCFDPYTL